MIRILVSLLPALVAALFTACSADEDGGLSPNIVLIMTDDQGWAQLGMRGDPVLKTPHLDQLASESVEFTRFYVSPVCAPTRASLMTGRYNYRTSVTDTWLGRAMMAPDEVTIAEMLFDAGYRTGIFGKWHLGDEFPMRAIDQGFEQAIVHKGGGIGQPSDPPGSDYFDPILFHNGVQKQYEGYCTDVYFNEAMRFIDEADERPFFIYLPTNAPHSPYLVADEYREPYAAQGLNDKDARIYGMITNIDDNVGRLLDHLESKNLRDNTIVIFMTDNGPTTQRFTAGLRGQKTQVYEGGIRAPFFMRWPARLPPEKIDTIAAHIDVAPTLLSAAGVEKPRRVRFDGRDLLALLDSEDPQAAANWPDRKIFIQSHRGDFPEMYRNMAVVSQRLKLIQPVAFNEPVPPDPTFELYDLETDPGEQRDIAGDGMNFRLANNLRADYEVWFRNVYDTRGFDPLPIYLGAEESDRVTFTRQDWRVVGDKGWGEGSIGSWRVNVQRGGIYDVQVDFKPKDVGGRVEVQLGSASAFEEFDSSADSVKLSGLEVQSGGAQLEVEVIRNAMIEGAWQVHVERVGDLPEAPEPAGAD